MRVSIHLNQKEIEEALVIGLRQLELIPNVVWNDEVKFYASQPTGPFRAEFCYYPTKEDIPKP